MMTMQDTIMIDDLEEELFREDETTLLIYAGLNDDGDRYIDIEIVGGHAHIDQATVRESLADYIGAYDLREAIKEIIRRLEESRK